ncbi:MAG: hypothetical protein NEA02_04055 [Thermoanaerobaculia bacterium]|nr:hypothetical protein [Thermoanaerobaculia bacterium]
MAACPVPAPVLTGPAGVQAGESYSLSWTNVLTSPTAQNADYYVVERSQDANFASGVDQTVTLRSAITLTPGAASARVLYHRIVVKSSCPTLSLAAIVSNVVAVPVKTLCDAPLSVGELHVDPSNPPAYSTWVVTWNTLGSGPGPGGGPTGLRFRIRRTSAFEPEGREWVVDGGVASFSGAPGDYVFQVRAEASCGALGPWSPSLRVTVGNVLKPALLLVSEPAPIAALVPAAGTRLTTSFVVRNGGTETIAVRAKADDSGFLLAPDSFALAPNAESAVVVTSLYVSVLQRPVHASVVLTAGETTLTVPVDCMLSAAPANAGVVWSDPGVDIDRDGNPVLRSIVNPSDATAAIVATVRAPWLTVVSLDGQPWDRPLAARETRTVQLVVDRARRRSGTGTEVGAVSLATVGFPEGAETLLVTDDGPAVAPTAGGAGATPAAAARTRLLYAAFPNAVDARGVGRFAADLWLTNSDAVNAVPVSLLFNPIGGPSDGSALRRYDLTLAAGETRRYRNVVGTLLGSEGAFTVEVRSTAPTLTATALVNNRPLPATVAARNASRRTTFATTPATGQYGFEMRPTIPGEGVKQSDPLYWVSGLAHDANRRSNLLLLETSGFDTKVLVDLFDKNGDRILKNGVPVSLERTIPANTTVQLFDEADLFDAAPLQAVYAYAQITWKDNSAADPDGGAKGSVVGMATVIDNRTQDSSLHVGVTKSGLQPLQSAGVSGATGGGARTAFSTLPQGGFPPTLSFPAVHAGGAPLEDGSRPFWRTRITLTNTAGVERDLRLKYVDVDGNIIRTLPQALGRGTVFSREDVLEELFDLPPLTGTFGHIEIENVMNNDGTCCKEGWADVDVQTEAYTVSPATGVGDFKTGMEGYSYRHGYSSFQSNLGTMEFDGAESSSAYRTNLILNEVTGSYCDVVVAAYLPGSFVPIATAPRRIPPNGYISEELFRSVLGLNLSELTDVRIVVRQVGGDGVFLAFASKIDVVSGDPANIFLRPAAAGTGR